MKGIDEKKAYIKEIDKCNLVAELVMVGFTVDDATDYVYDMLSMTKDEFAHKYNIY